MQSITDIDNVPDNVSITCNLNTLINSYFALNGSVLNKVQGMRHCMLSIDPIIS